MFLNIFFRLLLLRICLGETKETISSISFHRDDVTLSYKNNLHDYSIEKPRKQRDQIDYFRHRSNLLRSIQYAPLNPDEETFSDRTDMSKPTTRHELIKNKVHLEPRITEKSDNNVQVTPANFLQYIEGHNIVVPLKHQDNRHGHDILSDKNKETDMGQIGYDVSLSKLKQEDPEPQSYVKSLVTTTKSSTHIDLNKKQTLSPDEYPTKSIRVLSALENSQIEPVFNSYVKVPRLHLNIARAYNFARSPLKASVIGYMGKLLSNNPKKTFVPDIDVLLQKKTFLYPVDNDRYTLRT